jgi:hypothetical protein
MTESSFKEADGDWFWDGKGVVELWKEFWILWNLRLSSIAFFREWDSMASKRYRVPDHYSNCALCHGTKGTSGLDFVYFFLLKLLRTFSESIEKCPHFCGRF